MTGVAFATITRGGDTHVVELEPGTTWYWAGRCPFHDDGGEVPSLSVNARRELFHCFGCGEGGEVDELLFDGVPVHYFGYCPECGPKSYAGDVLNVGAKHWYVCRRHRLKWSVGENLFSGWERESEGDWVANQMRIADFREIEPVYGAVE